MQKVPFLFTCTNVLVLSAHSLPRTSSSLGTPGPSSHRPSAQMPWVPPCGALSAWLSVAPSAALPQGGRGVKALFPRLGVPSLTFSKAGHQQLLSLSSIPPPWVFPPEIVFLGGSFPFLHPLVNHSACEFLLLGNLPKTGC